MKSPEPRAGAGGVPARGGGDGAVSAGCRAARAKGWVVLAFCVAALVEVGENALGLEGAAWAVLRAAVGVVFIATLVLWIGLAFRAAGGASTWLGPVVTAVGLTVALVSLAWLLA